jgi:dipeptidyl aminopeptidase/acylaminoacyl peptidase
MAAHGYVVVAPNRRGLPGFGAEWNDAIAGDWGGQPMRDYLSAIDDISSELYIDRDHLGAVGASFGGYSVYLLAGMHEGRFKAFIAHDGIFNMESFYGSTEELFFAEHDIGGPYWKQPKPESYDRFSPDHYVQKWDTPMLVIHGAKDFRVPENQAMEAFTALQMKDIPSRFLYFPNENHWVLTPQNSILWHRVFYDWLDRWLMK